jgi:hypothetical protein
MAGHRLNRGPRCVATNRFGERCDSLANRGDLCAMHAGDLNPAEMGRRSGAARRAQRDRLAVLEREVELLRTAAIISVDAEDVTVS